MSKRKDWQPDWWTTWYNETYKCIMKLLINRFRRKSARGYTLKFPQTFYRLDVKEAFEFQLRTPLKRNLLKKKTLTSGYTNALNDMINNKEIERDKEYRGKYEVVYGSKLYREILDDVLKTHTDQRDIIKKI